jgi:hypothetical protein
MQSDTETIRSLFETGRLHGVRQDGTWTTTRELLEADLELLTEAARIDRFRAGIVPQPAGPDNPLKWLSIEWVEAGLASLRG